MTTWCFAQLTVAAELGFELESGKLDPWQLKNLTCAHRAQLAHNAPAAPGGSLWEVVAFGLQPS